MFKNKKSLKFKFRRKMKSKTEKTRREKLSETGEVLRYGDDQDQR